MARLLTVTLVAVVLSCALFAEGAPKRKRNPNAPKAAPKPADAPLSSQVPRHVAPGDTASMPNPDENERDRDYLECTGCMTAVDEIRYRFDKVREEFKYEPEKIKSYHILASVDEMCAVESLHYGMLRDDKTKIVHPKYVNEHDQDKNQLKDQHSTIKGGWATKLWTTHCEKLLERIEDDIVDLFHDKNKKELCPVCKPLRLKEEKAAAKAKKQKEVADAKKAKVADSVEGAAGVDADAPKSDL